MQSRRTFPSLAGAAALRAQDDAVFSAGVRVIDVLATVRTKGGEIVQNLAKDDFLLAEDGRPQTIRYFSQETNLPLVLGLLVDTSGSQRMVLGEEQEASYRFLEKVLREDLDRTFIARFDFAAEVLQNLTMSKPTLEKALQRVMAPSRFRAGGGGTVMYDAISLTSSLIMGKQKGRKALILLTDGVDHGSRRPMEQAIEEAQRADTLVYSILFSDETFGGRQGDFGVDGKKVLQKMSRETGGGFFEVSKKRPLDAIYAQLQEELRNQYSLGYTPEGAANNKAFRAIKLTTRRKGLVVQARSGYYPGVV